MAGRSALAALQITVVVLDTSLYFPVPNTPLSIQVAHLPICALSIAHFITHADPHKPPLPLHLPAQASSEIGDDVQLHSLMSKVALLCLHFPRLRIIWSRSLHATAGGWGQGRWGGGGAKGRAEGVTGVERCLPGKECTQERAFLSLPGTRAPRHPRTCASF